MADIWRDIKAINSKNHYHGRIVLYILYFEKKCKLKFPFKLLRRLIIQHLYLCEISPNSFDSPEHIASLRLPHPFLIIIHATAKIGIGCTIFHNVTIGVVENKGCPLVAARIEDYVYIGCGATILRSIIVHSNVKIGAHAIVLKEVPQNLTVLGVCK